MGGVRGVNTGEQAVGVVSALAGGREKRRLEKVWVSLGSRDLSIRTK